MIEYKGLVWDEDKNGFDMPVFTAASSWHDDGSPFLYQVCVLDRGSEKGMWLLIGNDEILGEPLICATLTDAMDRAAKNELELNAKEKVD